MIITTIDRNRDKYRYEILFDDGKVEWFMFLNDEVINDPRRFPDWLKGLVDMIQEKVRLS